jgi:hypothetical protein
MGRIDSKRRVRYDKTRYRDRHRVENAVLRQVGTTPRIGFD